jgi:pimeloyl-ACP methyl ester carboxylesterase
LNQASFEGVGGRVRAVDERGFGQSDKPLPPRQRWRDVHAFIEAKHLADGGRGIDLGAHEIGNWLGHALAANHPAHTASVHFTRSELHDNFEPRNDDRPSAFRSAGPCRDLLLPEA